MRDLKKILVAIDFSDCSLAAADYAAAMARRFGASVELFHAWQAPYYVSPEVVLAAGSLEATALKEARRELDALGAKLSGKYDIIVTDAVELGVAADRIAERANAGGFDLLVIGTHGRTGLAHLFLGSVAERVLRHARVPVTVIRAPLFNG